MSSHFSRKIVFTLLLCLFAGGLPLSASAQESGLTDVAVLNLEGEKVEDQLLKTLTVVLRKEAEEREDYDVNQSSINLSEVLVVLGCSTPNPTCLKQAAEQVDAQILVYGSVEKIDDRFEVEVEVFDSARREVTQRVVRTLRTDDPVGEFRKQVKQLFEEDEASEGTRVQIGSNIEGASIRIRDTVVGTTPLERKGLPPGEYEIEVFKEGYSTWKATVDLEEGSDIRLWAPLDEKPAAKPRTEDKKITSKSGGSDGSSPPEYVTSKTNWGAWSVVGVGGLALAGSGVMGILINRKEGELDELQSQAGTYESAGAYNRRQNEIIDQGQSYELAHRILLGVGLVSATTGVLWLILENPDSNESARSFDMNVGPRGASATFRW